MLSLFEPRVFLQLYLPLRRCPKEPLTIPAALILTGTGGAGKSTIAELIGRQRGWRHVSEADIWKECFGKDRGPFGSPEYRAKQKAVHASVFAFIETAMMIEDRVVIDATVHEAPPHAFEQYRKFFTERRISWAALRVLHPHLGVAMLRDATGASYHVGAKSLAALHAQFSRLAFSFELVIDTLEESSEQTLLVLLRSGVA